MKKISTFFLLLWSLFSITLFASKAPKALPHAQPSFGGYHGIRGVLDPSDRWDIYGNPIYADEKESEPSQASSKKESQEYEELQPLSAAELAQYEYEKRINKAHSPQMEKIWHYADPYDHHSPKKTSLLSEIDPFQLWDDFQKESNLPDSKPQELEQTDPHIGVLDKTKTQKRLSLPEFAALIDGETESENNYISTSSYSDDDSTDSEDDYLFHIMDNDLCNKESLIDIDAEPEPITNIEIRFTEGPVLLTVDTKEPSVARFLEACYTGCQDHVIVDFLEKYQGNKDILYQLINQTYPTPLFWATINGNSFIVEKLLPYVLFINPFDRSALFYAVLLKRRKIARRLLSLRFHVHPDNPAVRYHPHIDLISKAKTLKNFINSEWILEWTTYSPLRAAVHNNDYEMVQLLINAGASNVQSIETATISHTTDPRILNLLVEHNFISPKLLEQKLFFSQNKKNINCKTLWKDERYQALSRKSHTREEFNEQVIEIWKKHLIKPGA